MERKKINPHMPPTRPVHAVINDQKSSENVMIHLRLKRSPTNPPTGVMTANVQKSAVLIQPICRSVRCRSSWIGIVSRPNSTRSAWWKKNAIERNASSNHL